MANRQYNEKQYSQELKLAAYPVANLFMPYCYHMKSYKTLINYVQTHPKANDYLKEVMKESIDKMIKFTTESGIVASANSKDVSKSMPTIKHRLPLVMGVPLRIVSSHQGTEKKKRYSRLKNKAEIAKRRKDQRKPL
jgi:vacuolar-type H+-ATPase subunit D/Vma8